ncbi:MAG TPA: phospholipase C, phosphocholine-specific, partial [Burkholderiaceae bacterium]
MESKDRRRFLKTAATAASAVGANALPIGIQQALAIPAHRETGTIRDVGHIVILMQENRSFDHYFGTLRGVRGFGDPRPATLPGGQSVWHQPGNGGTVLPFHPALPNLGLQFLEGTPHDWTSTHQAWNGGRCDQWVPAKGTNTMAYFTRQDIPFHFALADAFTVCDAYHCSLLGPTDPNRYHQWTGWVGNDGSGGGPVVDNAEAGYGWTTFPERMTAAGVSWKVYQDVGEGLDAAGFWGWTDNPYIGNYGDNSLLYFHQYQDAQPGSPLYEGARRGTNVLANPQQGFFDLLRQDVQAGTLPQVSYIVAPEAYSEHPNWPANYGAWYVSQVLEALTSNPEVWSRTVLFVTFDENDGFFDHVPPPFPPASPSAGLSTVPVTDDIFPGSATYPAGPYGLGVRVPMTIVSPWTKGGWVCSQTFDHTSLIRFIEARFGASHPGLAEPNITPWRRTVAGDLTSAFDFADPDAVLRPLPSTAAYLPPDAARHDSVVPVPPVDQALPVQEPGLRRSRALPYAFEVGARLDPARAQLRVEFENRGRAGAAFIASVPGAADAPRCYTVEAGKSLADTWTTATNGGVYDLSVSGPNGFLRRFSGDAGAHGIAPEVRCALPFGAADLLAITLVNGGSRPVTLTLSSNAYHHVAPRSIRLAPGARAEELLPLGATFGWYDLSITCAEQPRFLRRLAGRVETGRPSVSDPA